MQSFSCYGIKVSLNDESKFNEYKLLQTYLENIFKHIPTNEIKENDFVYAGSLTTVSNKTAYLIASLSKPPFLCILFKGDDNLYTEFDFNDLDSEVFVKSCIKLQYRLEAAIEKRQMLELLPDLELKLKNHNISLDDIIKDASKVDYVINDISLDLKNFIKKVKNDVGYDFSKYNKDVIVKINNNRYIFNIKAFNGKLGEERPVVISYNGKTLYNDKTAFNSKNLVNNYKKDIILSEFKENLEKFLNNNEHIL